MKSSKIIIACAAALLAVSCGPKATVEGRLEDAAGKQVVVKVLDGNIRKTLDTLTVGQSGSFRYSLPVEAGDPRFLYFYYGDTKIASLLLIK